MYKIPMLFASILFLGVGLLAGGYCLDYTFRPYSEVSSIKKRSSLTPVEVVQEYAERSASCGALKTDDLTMPIPDEHMYLLFEPDDNYLEKRLNTPEGPQSLADQLRPVFSENMNEVFPRFLCANGFKFGRLHDQSIKGNLAKVRMDFIKPDGTFGLEWTFWLLRFEEGWRAFYLQGPGNERLKTPRERFKYSESDSSKDNAKKTKSSGTKLTIKARP